MAKQRVESYAYEPATTTTQVCVVVGCMAPIVAEVFADDYAEALALFRGVSREKVRRRRVGDERFYACQEHVEQYRRLRWQLLMF